MSYDVVIAGGGLAGSSLAIGLARAGFQVCVLERERDFRDRVRGEALMPWGVGEAKRLGIYQTLLDGGAHEVRWWCDAADATPRDLVATTPQAAGCLDFYHPDMQRALLDAAEEAGADVRRGATVVGVTPGAPPTARVREGGREHSLGARLIVGADGRNSRVRKSAGFELRRDRERMILAGLLLSGMGVPEDAVQVVTDLSKSQLTFVFPLGGRRFRSYFGYRKRQAPRPLSGPGHVADFMAACIETGAPAAWFDGAETAGPLAAYEGAASWTDHPYRDGVVLIGDAAGATDPTYGAGLSLTLRDVRVLLDHLVAGPDWDAACHAYAGTHDEYFGSLNRMITWRTDLFFETGPQAEALRARVLPRLTGPDSLPDLLGLGPDAPDDEAARRQLFAEDCGTPTERAPRFPGS